MSGPVSAAGPVADGAVRAPRLQGEPGIWLVVVLDTVAFGVLFGMFLVYRGRQPAVFAAGHAELSLVAGTVNTLILLASSVVVVAAVTALRAGRDRDAARLFRAAAGLGLLFVLAKALEWGVEVARGLTPRTDDFFMLYFGLTGLHLLHVVIGVGVLLAASVRAGRGGLDAVGSRMVESGATFWHLVDVLWLILFPTVYLVA